MYQLSPEFSRFSAAHRWPRLQTNRRFTPEILLTTRRNLTPLTFPQTRCSRSFHILWDGSAWLSLCLHQAVHRMPVFMCARHWRFKSPRCFRSCSLSSHSSGGSLPLLVKLLLLFSTLSASSVFAAAKQSKHLSFQASNFWNKLLIGFQMLRLIM